MTAAAVAKPFRASRWTHRILAAVCEASFRGLHVSKRLVRRGLFLTCMWLSNLYGEEGLSEKSNEIACLHCLV